MTAPYLTLLEYRAAPTATDTSSLVQGGVQAVQDAELANVIRRASGMMDNVINIGAGFVASTRTNTQKVRVTRDGEMRLHPGDKPLISLSTLTYGVAADQLLTVSNLAGVWVDEEDFIVPAWAGIGSLNGIQFSHARPGSKFMARYTFVAGFPNTTLAVTATAPTTSLTLASTIGMAAGTILTIMDADKTEDVTVATVPSATTVTLAAATASTHTFTAGIGNSIAVHAMPWELKEAAVLVTTALVKNRGSEALVMGQLLSPGPATPTDPVAGSNLSWAKNILSSYRRTK